MTENQDVKSVSDLYTCEDTTQTDELRPSDSDLHSSQLLQHCVVCSESFPNIGSLVKHDMIFHSNRKVAGMMKDAPKNNFATMPVSSEFSVDEKKASAHTTVNGKVQRTLVTKNTDNYNITYSCNFESDPDDSPNYSSNSEEIVDDALPVSKVHSSSSETNLESNNGHDKQKAIFCENDNSEETFHINTTIIPELNCEVCGKLFKLKSYLRRHMKLHGDYKPYSCDKCDYRAYQPSYLKAHMAVHSKEGPSFVCNYCGDCNFKTANGLAKHQRLHGVKEYVLTCPECGKGFFENCDLRDHMNTHTGDTPYKCDSCDKSFAIRARLKAHLKCHTRPHVCNKCGKSFQEQRHLKKHERWHKGEKPFKCQICNKFYSDKDHLKSHMKIHNGERNHTCGVCGKKFLTRGDVNKHLRVHSGEKPYKCDFCDMHFRQRGHLTTHLRVHNGEKPYMCTECGKTFTTSTGLKNHRIYEKGLKPYCCDVCSTRFNRLDKLKRHQKSHLYADPNLKSYIRMSTSDLNLRPESGLTDDSVALDALAIEEISDREKIKNTACHK